MARYVLANSLDGLRLGKPHEQDLNRRLFGPFLKQCRKALCLAHQLRAVHIRSYYDPAGIKIIVKRLSLSEEFRAEQNIVCPEQHAHMLGISDGHRYF